MKIPHLLILVAALCSPAAWAQQAPPAQAATKTTEQQARSFILSAIMTGAAPGSIVAFTGATDVSKTPRSRSSRSPRFSATTLTRTEYVPRPSEIAVGNTPITWSAPWWT